jgi:peptidoglycan/xylan/chitin deacetylase (PgdA/CDA1 family)
MTFSSAEALKGLTEGGQVMNEPPNWLPEFMRESRRSTNGRTLSEVKWPRGARCCVSVHVHVDAQTIWRALNREKLVYVSVGEFGARTGVWRVLDVLERHGIPASFFVPGWTAAAYPDIVREINRSGHEVGHHSYTHTMADMGLRPDGTWDREIEEREFDRALLLLRDLSGQPIHGYVPPGGELSPHTIEILVSRGIRYQAQCSADDIPYWWYVDGQPCGLLEVPTHWSIDDAPQFLYTLIPQEGLLKSAAEVYRMWRDDFDAFHYYGRCMVLQVHPQWIGRPARIRMLDRLLGEIKAQGDVWFATGDQIDSYWRATYPPPNLPNLSVS